MYKRKMNKKGFIGIVFFFIILLMILVIGFAVAMILSAVDYASDTITPVMTSLGVVGNTNLSQAGEQSFGTLNKVIQALPWLTGFLFVVALIFSVIFAVSYSNSISPAFIGVYLIFIILLIFGSIIISNMYENIYKGTDEIAIRLQEQTLTSYLILYSPFILSLIAIITGIYLFTKPLESSGGFGI